MNQGSSKLQRFCQSCQEMIVEPTYTDVRASDAGKTVTSRIYRCPKCLQRIGNAEVLRVEETKDDR